MDGYDEALADLVVQTGLDELHSACHTHHDGKSHGIWTVRRDPASGVTTWTGPTGHTYRREPVRPPGPPPTGRSDPPPAAARPPGVTGDDPDESSADDGLPPEFHGPPPF